MYDKPSDEKDKPLDIITRKFVDFATRTFGQPNSGKFLGGIGIGHAVAKLFVALGFTKTMFDSKPLKQGLIETFGENTSLFSMARERMHQCSTRVAVVATTNAGDTKCLITSY